MPSCIPSHAHDPSVSAPEHVRGCRWPGQVCIVRGVYVRGRERGRGIERHAGAARPHPAGWMGRVTLQKHARKESGKPRGGVGMRDVAKGQGTTVTTPVLGLWRRATSARSTRCRGRGRRALALVGPRSWQGTDLGCVRHFFASRESVQSWHDDDQFSILVQGWNLRWRYKKAVDIVPVVTCQVQLTSMLVQCQPLSSVVKSRRHFV